MNAPFRRCYYSDEDIPNAKAIAVNDDGLCSRKAGVTFAFLS
jgi:hypothetical protein